MTRINVVPVETLHYKHLVAEYKEITRVFGLARKSQFDVIKGKRKLPVEYTLGTGHVLFFYNKLKYIHLRYKSLIDEMHRRGYNPNPIQDNDLLAGISTKLYNDYSPTAEAIRINSARILERSINL